MAQEEKKRRGRKAFLTDEEREKRSAARKQKWSQMARGKRSAMRAAKAIAEGREPGKAGNQKRQTPEERKAYLAKWRAENKEKIRQQDAALQRRRRAERAIAEGRQPGRIGAIAKYTDEERVDLRRARCLAYWEKHPEKRKELAARYHQENKDRDRVKVRNRRARKKEVGGKHTVADIEALWELQKGRCVFCLKPLMGGKYHVDHHVPLAKGGSNDRSNLRLLHKKCNLEKGARDPVEHAQRNGMLCW